MEVVPESSLRILPRVLHPLPRSQKELVLDTAAGRHFDDDPIFARIHSNAFARRPAVDTRQAGESDRLAEAGGIDVVLIPSDVPSVAYSIS